MKQRHEKKVGAIIRVNFEHAADDTSQYLKNKISILIESQYISQIVLAIPDTSFHKTFSFYEKETILFRGNPSDMIDRMLKAAEQFDIEIIIDIPLGGDLESPRVIDKMIGHHLKQKSKFTKPTGCLPGVLPKIINYDYLKQIHSVSSQWPYYHTLYSHSMPVSYYPYPTSFSLETLEKMNPLHLAAAGERIRTLLKKDSTTGENPLAWMNRAKSLIKEINKFHGGSNLSVLEIGCGNRFGLGLFLKEMGISRYTGIDLCPLDIGIDEVQLFMEFFKGRHPSHGASINQKSDSYFKKEKNRIIFANGDITILAPLDASNLPFGDETFDIVFSDAVIEHVQNPARVFKEMTRVLKPNGVMLHNIDFKDHHPDGSGCRFLSVSKEDWVASCQQVYINLMRFKDLERIIDTSHLDYLFCKKYNFPDTAFPPIHIHKDYEMYNTEELKIAYASLVLNKRP